MPDDSLRRQAVEWREWAIGYRKDPPHQLLGFTTDVLALCAERDLLRAENERMAAIIERARDYCSRPTGACTPSGR